MTSAKNKPKSIDDYLSQVSREHRAALQDLRRAVRAAVPNAEERISYGLPSFYLDGHPFVAFGSWAKHCAFYPMSSATIKAFQKELKDFPTSKGTVQFAPEKPLPKTLLKKLIKARIAEAAS